VACYAKGMFAGHGIANSVQVGTLKFDQLIADRAMQVIVLGVAIVVFVDGSAAEGHAAQQPGIDEFVECAINGRPADLVAFGLLREIDNQLFGIEVIVPLEDMIDQNPPLLGDPLSLAL